MQMSEHLKKEPLLLLRILVLALVAVTGYALSEFNTAKEHYDQTSAALSQQPSTVKKVTIGDKTLAIPNYSLFKTGNVWALVSRNHPLVGEAGYALVDIPVPHGDAEAKMQVARDISEPLQRLVNAAEADGGSLMISSAYRSLDEQRELRDDFVAKQGEAMASLYVSPVGASEHHTGLSVDFSSASTACSKDSNSCSLGVSSAKWLASNAPRFGFILRYPEGKQPITGVGHEPWHYRYVGAPMAQAIASSDLTFDEVVQQIAPGYAKTR
jgi:D-alanyl-D-alanine carboxypeptidase